jgi:2,4-dienoyl-CoA reductase-like NADH-dependent reductase (Old Yellow Enzyme family)
MTAMTSNYAEDHILSERHIAFYRERAKGGAALMITEQQGAVHQGLVSHGLQCVGQTLDTAIRKARRCGS